MPFVRSLRRQVREREKEVEELDKKNRLETDRLHEIIDGLEEDLKKGGTTTVGQLAAMTCAQVEALTHALFNMPFVLGEATAGFETSKRGDRPQRFEGTSEQAEDEGPSGGGDDLHRGGGEDQG